MNSTNIKTRLLAASLCGAVLAGCNAVETADESPVIPVPAATVVINGSVSGVGSVRPVDLTIVTTNNGLNSGTRVVSVRDTNVLRFGSVSAGASYAITISRVPFGRTCTLQNGTGTATADVENVTVTCVRDSTPQYKLTAAIAPAIAAAPPAGFAVTLKTEEGTETITPTAGQTSVTFNLPLLYPGSTTPPAFSYTVTATTTAGAPAGTTNSCAVTNPTGALALGGATTVGANVTNVTVSACTFTIGAAASYNAPPGGAASAMGTGGLQLELKNQITGAVEAQAPLISAYSTTVVNIPGPTATGGAWVSNPFALYEVSVKTHPTNQFCIVQNGGLAQLVTAQANVTVQVLCRDVPATANQLKGSYGLQPRAVNDSGVAIAAPLEAMRNFLTFFPNGTFIYGIHHTSSGASSTAPQNVGVEHGFYSYNPGASTLGFTVWTDTNGLGAGATFSPDFSTGFPAINWNQGLSGRAGFGMPFSFTTFAVSLPGNITATNVTKTTGSATVPGTLSLQFGANPIPPVPPATASTPNWNNVLTFVEPVNTPNQLEGSWTTADSKRVFIYNKTTLYGFHAGVNGAPNLQDVCLAIENPDVASGFYMRRGGDTFCMATPFGATTADIRNNLLNGLTTTGTTDVPNANNPNTTTTPTIIAGFAGRLPGAISNTVLSPSPIRFTITSGTPDTLTIQNTLNDIPLGDPVVFKRATTY